MTLEEIVNQTMRNNADKLSKSITANNTLLNYLERNGRKPRKWSFGYEVGKWRGRIGRLFLKAANGLGEYNETDY